MIVLDSNLLIYAQVADFPQYDRARTWLDEQLNGIVGVGMPWPSLLGFVRVVSNRRIFRSAISVTEAWAQVERWLALPAVWVPEPAQRHHEILRRLMVQTGRAELVPDAHLAALAIEYGLVLQTADRDFARFTGLRWANPLET